MIATLLAGCAGVPWLAGTREPPAPTQSATQPIDLAVVVDLAAAAMAAGASVPRTIEALGRACRDPDLEVVARALQLGADWEDAWGEAPARYRPLADALAPAWLSGVDTHRVLTSTADHLRARRQQYAREAAEKLAVRLVVPLGLCQLPAFILIGLVPVVLALL